MNKLYEGLKIDIGLVSQALNNTNATGNYHSMAEYRKGIALLSGGAMAVTKTTKLEIFEAKDADGTSGALISGAAAVITLKATDPGEKLLTVTSTDATFTIATTKAQAYVEFDDYEPKRWIYAHSV